MGKPGFPISLLERQSVATKVTAPLPTSPRWGEAPDSLPPAGGGLGRGARAPHALR